MKFNYDEDDEIKITQPISNDDDQVEELDEEIQKDLRELDKEEKEVKKIKAINGKVIKTKKEKVIKTKKEKILNFELRSLLINTLIILAGLIAVGTWLIIIAFDKNSKNVNYILPGIIGSILAIILIFMVINNIFTRKSVNKYTEEIKLHGSSDNIPRLVTKVYIRIHKSIIKSIWFFIVSTIYLTSIFLYLHFTKGQTLFKGELNFDNINDQIFSNAEVVYWTLVVAMSINLVATIGLNIWWRVRRQSIETEFSSKLVSVADLDAIKSRTNKICLNVSIGSFLLIMVVPFVFYIIAKKVVK